MFVLRMVNIRVNWQDKLSSTQGRAAYWMILYFKVRGAFETSDGSLMDIPVHGHNELRFRIVDEGQTPSDDGQPTV